MKLFRTALSAIPLSLMQISIACASLPMGAANQVTGIAQDAGTELGIKSVIIKAIQFVLDFVLLVATIYVIVAGIRLIVSNGDEGEKDKAKQIIIYVIIGIVVILFSKVIVGFVNNMFT